MKKGLRNIFATLFMYLRRLFLLEEFSAAVYDFSIFTDRFIHQI